MNVEELIGMSDNELAELVKERVAKLMESYTEPDIDALARFTALQGYGPASVLIPSLIENVKVALEGNDEMRQRFLSGHRALQHNIYVESVMLEIANDALIETMEGSKNA